MSFHTRSNSLPSTSEPTALKIKEELSYLKSVLVSSESAITSQLILNGIKRLGNLYDLIEELLHLPRNQQISSFSHRKKCVEEDLDLSINIVDFCSGIRDTLVESLTNNQVKDATRKSKLQLQKIQKDIKNCLRSFKQNANKCKDGDLLMLNETREVTINLLQVVLSFISGPKNCKWSFVSKVVQQRKGVDIGRLEYFENEVECLFKRLMQNRVSLLNIISL